MNLFQHMYWGIRLYTPKTQHLLDTPVRKLRHVRKPEDGRTATPRKCHTVPAGVPAATWAQLGGWEARLPLAPRLMHPAQRPGALQTGASGCFCGSGGGVLSFAGPTPVSSHKQQRSRWAAALRNILPHEGVLSVLKTNEFFFSFLFCQTTVIYN